ncbi:MAG: 50S ribosomal protein L2 [Candidatus Kerfeldbacteria bacterium]|nr:50S ribosomal protein L2 [Candidatus Kerfeldbacteria bacterium]
MPIRIHKPTSPGRRKSSVDAFRDITKSTPEKALTEALHRGSGRNSQGKISVRHRGGGHARRYRLVDFRQEKLDMPATVLAVEYDPNRTARIALVEYGDKERRYILAPEGTRPGHIMLSSMNKIDVQPGNRLPLKHIPTGMLVYNLELVPGRGGKIVRSAGSSATIMALEGGFAHIKLPSGEVRMIPADARATVGQVSNIDYRNIRWGKAGRKRWLGIRPSVRGKAMNPVDHPHGGGEGNQPIGLKSGPKTYTGKLALGVKTRSHNKVTNRFIVKRRTT